MVDIINPPSNGNNVPPTDPLSAMSLLPSAALFSVAQLRETEQCAQALLPPHALMQRAGLAAANLAGELIAAQGTVSVPPVPTALIVAGPGNNGGDAFECGAHLAVRGWRITVLVPLPAPQASADRMQSLARLQRCSVDWVETADPAVLRNLSAQPWSLVIDGLFGIGVTRALSGAAQVAVDCMNAIAAPLLALDVPSGLNADTGAIAAGDGPHAKVCVRATHTLTFIGDKPGLHTCDGRDHVGLVSVAGLDIPAAQFPPPTAWLNRPELFAHASHVRLHNSHKGSFGDVQIIGGASGMRGAALLAAHAALKSGSGRVLIGFADADADATFNGAPQYDPVHPELMCCDAEHLDFSHATLVVGPGLGTTPAAGTLLMRACRGDTPLVVDADALNLVATTPSLADAVGRRADRGLITLMTPHPLEAARLLAHSAASVQADRLGAAGELAMRYRATVILKGSGTVIADGSHLVINPTGNPALATGGTGDVLSGMCGALLAQGWPAREAALGAVWIHGKAADRLVACGVGPTGVTATEIIDAARIEFNLLARRTTTRWPG